MLNTIWRVIRVVGLGLTMMFMVSGALLAFTMVAATRGG